MATRSVMRARTPVRASSAARSKGIGKRENVGGTVAFDDDPLQAEQGGSIVTTGIDTLLEFIQYGEGDRNPDLGQDIATELLPQESRQHLRQPLRRLERDVADKTVANDNFGIALVQAVAFDVADEVEPGFLEQFGGALDDVVALDVFFADVGCRPSAVPCVRSPRPARSP